MKCFDKDAFALAWDEILCLLYAVLSAGYTKSDHAVWLFRSD